MLGMIRTQAQGQGCLLPAHPCCHLCLLVEVYPCMCVADAEPYMASLVKAFRRTVEEGRFSVVIVDAPHLLADDLKAYWASGQVRLASSSCVCCPSPALRWCNCASV